MSVIVEALATEATIDENIVSVAVTNTSNTVDATVVNQASTTATINNAVYALTTLESSYSVEVATGLGFEQQLFIGNTAPASPPASYLWIQTGLGSKGTDVTFWIGS